MDAATPLLLRKIVSGAQTGADRAALDFAIQHNIPHGGWCPKGRLAEDGPIAACYLLRETPTKNYPQRTEWNARDSDGTAIFTLAAILSGGSKRTMEFAQKHGKPCLHLSGSLPVEECARQLHQFIVHHGIRILNVAGSRASKEPKVGAFVHSVLMQAITLAQQKTDSACPFCGLQDQEFVIETPRIVAFRDSYPISKGHTLIIPTSHVASIFDLPADAQWELWQVVAEVRRQLQQELQPQAFNIGVNDGQAAGQTVPHAHVHVIPRYDRDVADPRGGVRWVIPEKADYWSEQQ